MTIEHEKVLMYMRLGGEAEFRQPDGSPYVKGAEGHRWYIGDEDVHDIIMSIALLLASQGDNPNDYTAFSDGEARWVLRKTT